MAKSKQKRAPRPKKVVPVQEIIKKQPVATPPKPKPIPVPVPEVVVTDGVGRGARQKKAKVVFDPADYETPPVPRKRSQSVYHENPPKRRQSVYVENPRKKVAVPTTAPAQQQVKIKTEMPSLLPVKSQAVRQQQPVKHTQTIKQPQQPIIRSEPVIKRDPIILCSICKDGKNTERKISCVDCPFKGHITCLKFNDRKDLVMLELNFQCEKCRTCSTCYETSAKEALIVCPKCNDAYHADCHIPPIKDKHMTDGKEWCCSNCYMASRKTDKKIKLNKTVPPPIEKPLPLPSAKIHKNDFVDIEKPEREENFEGFSDLEQSSNDFLTMEKVPNVAKWSPREVQKFFHNKYPAEAKIFFNEEVDGAALLLMSRSDVLRLLNRKLGPAINIYRMILRFQTGSNDVTLGWF